jgi:hypothetical protein
MLSCWVGRRVRTKKKNKKQAELISSALTNGTLGELFNYTESYRDENKVNRLEVDYICGSEMTEMQSSAKKGPHLQRKEVHPCICLLILFWLPHSM